MFRKPIVALVLCLAFLLIVTNLVTASEPNVPAAQMDMGTPTLVPQPLSTPVSELPLSGTTAQMGTCPMMSSDASLSGMNMGGTSGMSTGGMSGMNMGGAPGMNMGGMLMAGGNGMVTYNSYSSLWYSNPWWLLGWVLLSLLVIAILAGVVYGAFRLARRDKAVPPAEA